MLLSLSLVVGATATVTAVAAASPARWSSRWTGGIRRGGVANCTVPAWTIRDINVTYSAETETSGNVTFTLTNTATNHTEALGCPIRYNSICNMEDPNDPDLEIQIQTSIDKFYIGLNQTRPCGNTKDNSTSYAISLL